MKNNFSLKFKIFDIFVGVFTLVLIVGSIIFTNVFFSNKSTNRYVQIYYQNNMIYEIDYEAIVDSKTITLSKDKYENLHGTMLIEINKEKGIRIKSPKCKKN